MKTPRATNGRRHARSACPPSRRPELAAQTGQATHRPMLQALSREWFAYDTTAHWLARLEAQDLLCAPVRVLAEALDDEQTAVNGTPAELRRPAPRLGADSDEVLAPPGYGPERIAELRDAGVIGG